MRHGEIVDAKSWRKSVFEKPVLKIPANLSVETTLHQKMFTKNGGISSLREIELLRKRAISALTTVNYTFLNSETTIYKINLNTTSTDIR